MCCYFVQGSNESAASFTSKQ